MGADLTEGLGELTSLEVSEAMPQPTERLSSSEPVSSLVSPPALLPISPRYAASARPAR